MNSGQIKFGIPEEWRAFQERHPKLIEKLKLLFGTLEKIFIREMEVEELSSRVIFFLGRLAIEDFMEILLLCGNGYGIGGMKLLRGLYERCVTLGYIAKNPDKADDFYDYHHIHIGKFFNHAKEHFNKHLSQNEIAQIQDNYKKTKEKYRETICTKCGTSRVMMSWSKLDLLSMAREAGLDDIYWQCYLVPTLQAHATMSSLIYRLKAREDGGLSFIEGAQHDKVDMTLIAAHNVMLHIIAIINDYFKMGLEKEIEERFADFKFIRKKENAL